MNRDKNLPLTETTYYVLLALLEPAHGYLIMQKVEELSNQQVKIAAGTLYGAVENFKTRVNRIGKSEDKRKKSVCHYGTRKEVLHLDFMRMQHIIEVTKSLLHV